LSSHPPPSSAGIQLPRLKSLVCQLLCAKIRNNALQNKDLGLTIHKSEFDQYNLFYVLEAFQRPADPSMTVDDSVSDMWLPTSQRWSYFLCNVLAQCNKQWNVHCLPREN
jgi:hypothetical protein